MPFGQRSTWSPRCRRSETVGAPELAARAGVLTGEAAVTLGAEGQGMVAGDMVNTHPASSRQQSRDRARRRGDQARIGGVHCVRGRREHELKGKEELVPLWQALRIVANRGGERRANTLEAPFVGRDREFRVVKDAFHGSGNDARATLVTVLGIAGIGKSRLAWELEKHSTVWPRTSGGTAAAVSRTAKASPSGRSPRWCACGPESRRTSRRRARRRSSARWSRQYVTDHGEREWVEPMLRHLLGLGERLQVERTDLFAAWRLFIERMSETSPVALVFEDLHWADTALLDFIEHLLEWSRAQPIFVLALSRPELLERRADFGATAAAPRA